MERAVSAGFTPGPWLLEKERDGDFSVWAREPLPNALATILYEDINGGNPVEANARLIAAAPELYGQIESGQTDLDLLRRAIEEDDPKAELLIRVTDLWKRNDAALAKATQS
jgi:uncharacterized protein involved in type VI secretion and phage assembly